MMNICDIIQKRRSCRAYTDQPVALETVRSFLGPKTREKLASSLFEKFDAGIASNPDYDFCPDSWSDAYKLRRKACGQALYQSLGVALEDGEGKRKHKRRNYNFYEAPIGLIVFIDKGMPKGSWLDVGLFIQNFLIAAEELGLATCAQASFADYPDVVRDILSLEKVDIVCGIALGYRDTNHPLNSYRTQRASLEHFSQWYD